MKNEFINNYDKNQSLLFITKDTTLIEKISQSYSPSTQKLFCTTKNDFNSLLNDLNKYELIIFDTRYEEQIIDFTFFYNQIIDINATIVLIGEELEQNFLDHDYTRIYTFLPTSMSYNSIVNNIQLCQRYVNSKVKFDFRDGISFDCNTNSLLKNKQTIELTRSESMIIKLLVKNINSLVEYKDLEDYLWKNKNFSKDTLRNKIRNIRKKTNPTFIRNVSKKGYILNSL